MNPDPPPGDALSSAIENWPPPSSYTGLDPDPVLGLGTEQEAFSASAHCSRWVLRRVTLWHKMTERQTSQGEAEPWWLLLLWGDGYLCAPINEE